MSVTEIKKLLKTDKLVVGKERTFKNLKLGKLEKVYLSSNCDCVGDVEHYANLAKVPVSKLRIPNDELGVVCKKPFSISIVSVLKG